MVFLSFFLSINYKFNKKTINDLKFVALGYGFINLSK